MLKTKILNKTLKKRKEYNMKKLFLTMFVAVLAIGAQAQVYVRWRHWSRNSKV